MSRGLRVGGFVPLSSTDFPGQLAAVVFCQGCPWRCRYCHNPHLQPTGGDEIAWTDVLSRLERRRGLLDAVVFSGGEPTAQPAALANAIEAVRSLGFHVALHTAGIYPDTLRRLLPHLDWVGFDIKAACEGYAALTGVPGAGERAESSLRALLESGVAYEVRTTVHPALLSREDLWQLAERLARLGVRRYAVQQFRNRGCADAELNTASAELSGEPLRIQLAPLFEAFELRSA